MFLKSREDFWVATISKTSTFEVPEILWEFFSPSFGWVLPVAWPRAAAPEAEHRCTAQPAKATIPWSSGSSRRRRPWMLRTKRAVASEEDLDEDSVVKCMKMLMVHWRFNFLVDIVFTFFFGNLSKHLTDYILLLHFGSECLWIKDFSLEIECHAHHNSNCFWVSRVSILMWYIIKHCLTGSLFAGLINRTNLRFSSSYRS